MALGFSCRFKNVALIRNDEGTQSQVGNAFENSCERPVLPTHFSHFLRYPALLDGALCKFTPKDVITIGDYEILGYGRFELDIEFNTDAISLGWIDWKRQAF